MLCIDHEVHTSGKINSNANQRCTTSNSINLKPIYCASGYICDINEETQERKVPLLSYGVCIPDPELEGKIYVNRLMDRIYTSVFSS